MNCCICEKPATCWSYNNTGAAPAGNWNFAIAGEGSTPYCQIHAPFKFGPDKLEQLIRDQAARIKAAEAVCQAVFAYFPDEGIPAPIEQPASAWVRLIVEQGGETG